MATNLSLYDCADEDYIDMELSSSPSSILCCSTNSSPQSREFEFQMSLTCNEKETTSFPADELFYKGKLLPLHLPPRRQMVENLLHTSTTTFDITKEAFEEDHYYSMPFTTCSTAPCTNTMNTPLDSCNISPSESCRVSCELNPDEYFFEWSTELSSFVNNHPTKKTWSNKLKLIKHSILGQKLKASRAYLKSLFSKSACSDESCAKANCNAGAENLPKAEESSNKYLKIAKKKPLEHIGRASYPTIATIMKNIDREGIEDNVHRRSFSSAIKRHSPTKCLSSSSSNSSSAASSSSSSFSLNSNGFHELHFLRRSSSATEIEGSIEAAIAHCKKSQQIFDSRNSSREPGICSWSASRIADEEDQKRPGLCSI
ncbi:hypothetical protein Pfo_029337 [Paulownia fortunei]|nr:hypothetical protein Pfo_029337 [Paulownia fortunei]